jgi:chromosome segregation ATPase
MLIRISLIVAIIAGLAVGALNFVTVKQKVTTLQTNLATETEQHRSFEAQFNKTKKTLAETAAQLTQTNFALVLSWNERDKAFADRDTAVKHAGDLTDKLAKATKERDDAKDELFAFQAAGLTPAKVVSLSKDLKALQDNLVGAQDENLLLARKLPNLNTSWTSIAARTPSFSSPNHSRAKWPRRIRSGTLWF